jgi:peptidoglycan/xylan/chitin deacetylase (PgdA/CDA1 family)
VISVDPATFAGHVRWLASGHVPVVPVADLLARPGRDPAVTLTFDDAFANFATAVWPLLRDHGLPVTVFVPTAFVGRSNSWSAMPGGAMAPLPLLDWATLGRLVEEGVTLGAHSRIHPDLRTLDEAALEDEVGGSMDDIARETGRRAEGFAYPYGYLDDRVVRVVRNACQWAVTTELRPLGTAEDPCLLPRLDAYYFRGLGRLDRYASRPFRWWMEARRVARAARGRP